jgi:hypothetical protein
MNINKIHFLFSMINIIIFSVESSVYEQHNYHIFVNRTVNFSANSTWLIKIFKINSTTKCFSECDDNKNCLSISYSYFKQNCVLFNKYIHKNDTILSSVEHFYAKKHQNVSINNEKVWYIVGILSLIFVIILVYAIVRIDV